MESELYLIDKDGDEPEIMTFNRLLEYASNMVEMNKGDEDCPCRNENITTVNGAIKVIMWAGEDVKRVSPYNEVKLDNLDYAELLNNITQVKSLIEAEIKMPKESQKGLKDTLNLLNSIKEEIDSQIIEKYL